LEEILTNDNNAYSFNGHIRSLAKNEAKSFKGSLETYLSALLAVVQDYRNETPSWRLIAKILEEAFQKAPLPFDNNWLEYNNPANEITDGDFEIDELDKNLAFEALIRMVKYQISDLHKMAEAGTLNHPYRYYGIESPTGHIWYNFEPVGFLSCAISGMKEIKMDFPCTWIALGVILWLGQIYE
jgi:hypothetical protein